jgi:hypothetical protein
MTDRIVLQTIGICIGFIATFLLALNQTVEQTVERKKKVVYFLAFLIAIAFVLNAISLALQ